MPAPDVTRVLGAHFTQLDAQQQEAMLTWRWGIVAGEPMIPALRTLVAADSTAVDAVRDMALIRLGELDPDEAERLSRDDVLSGRMRFAARALRIPEEREEAFAAEVSSLLVMRLSARATGSRVYDQNGAGARGILPLLARFGTASDVEAVITHFTPIPGACAMRSTLAAYVLRADPARGEALLRDLLDTTTSRCAEHVVETLARAWPQVLPVPLMIETLDHPDARVAASAATALARIGDAEAHVVRRWSGVRARVIHPRGHNTCTNNCAPQPQNAESKWRNEECFSACSFRLFLCLCPLPLSLLPFLRRAALQLLPLLILKSGARIE